MLYSCRKRISLKSNAFVWFDLFATALGCGYLCYFFSSRNGKHTRTHSNFHNCVRDKQTRSCRASSRFGPSGSFSHVFRLSHHVLNIVVSVAWKQPHCHHPLVGNFPLYGQRWPGWHPKVSRVTWRSGQRSSFERAEPVHKLKLVTSRDHFESCPK